VTASATAARRLSCWRARGAYVLVVNRGDLTLAERTVAMIAGEGGKAVAVSYDVTESGQRAAMVEDAVSRWGRLDCLDNNVAIGSKHACP
jgi:NAD(P)-dependent dehydrogenase (short-subunit alcohol dehydrogenase family)